MKTALNVLSVLMLSCLIAAPAMAQAPVFPPQPRTISVTGDAEIKVVPDQVIVSMTAENRAPDLKTAKEANNKTVGDLLAFVQNELKVEAKNVQTDFESIEPVYRSCNYDDEMRGTCSSLEVAFYNVRKGVQIKLDDPKLYENLMAGALGLGITRVDNVQFITTELRKHRDKAREMAAAAAKEKAEALAKTLGVAVTKPLNINANDFTSFYGGNYGGPRGGAMYRMAQNVAMEAAPAADGGGGSTMALGQITVTANVNVTFEIE